jgi:hypothetical protein
MPIMLILLSEYVLSEVVLAQDTRSSCQRIPSHCTDRTDCRDSLTASTTSIQLLYHLCISQQCRLFIIYATLLISE